MAGYNRNLTLVYMTVRGLNSLLKVRAAVADNSHKPLMVTNRRSIHGMRILDLLHGMTILFRPTLLQNGALSRVGMRIDSNA